MIQEKYYTEKLNHIPFVIPYLLKPKLNRFKLNICYCPELLLSQFINIEQQHAYITSINFTRLRKGKPPYPYPEEDPEEDQEYISSLQLIDPLIKGKSPFEKIYFKSNVAINKKPILEENIRQKYIKRPPSFIPFLDYSAFLTDNQMLLYQATQSVTLNTQSILDILNKKYFNLTPNYQDISNKAKEKRHLKVN